MGTSGKHLPVTAGVTVVVPVFNPSHYIERTIESVLDQTLPRSRYEVVFVDDGSTDGTEVRLDELAAEHPELVRVIHQPNSGGPGGPRNLGTEAASHDYVFFCDADDWLPRDALETMVDRAVHDGSDIVIAKTIGNRGTVPLALYDRGDFATTLTETPGIFTTLTCQKLFRREHLIGKGIRFPEGRVRIEDYIFMTEAYLRAERISIVGSRPCYIFESRADSANITATPAPPMARLESVVKMIDVIEAFAVDERIRDVALGRVVHSGMINVVTGRRFRDLLPEERTAVFDIIAELLRTRIPASALNRMGSRNRRFVTAVLEGDRDLLERLGRWERDTRAVARTTEVVVAGERVHLDVEVTLTEREQPVRLERVDGRDLLLRSADSPGYDVTDDLRRTVVHIILRNGQTTENWRVRADLQAMPGVASDAVELRWRARAIIDVTRAGGGRRLSKGVWRLRVQVGSLGMTRTSPIDAGDAIAPAAPEQHGGGPVRAISTNGLLAVRVGQPRGAHRSGAPTGLVGPMAGSGTVHAMSSPTERRRPATGWRRWAGIVARRFGLTITESVPGTVLLTRRREPLVSRLNAATFVLAQGRHAARIRTRDLGRGSWLVDVPGASNDPAELSQIDDGLWLVSAPRLLPRPEPARETEVLRRLGAKHVAWLLARYQIDCVLDVGANKGQYGSSIRRAGYTGHIVSFEPVPRFAAAIAKLADRDDTWAVRNVALGRTEGTVPIHVQRTFSSLLPASDYGMNRFSVLREKADTKTVDVAVQRLDAILDDVLAPLVASGVTRPRIMLKMDTQGFDLEAFAGLGERAKDILVLQSEVALLPIYEQMPRMTESLAVYEAAGFEVAGLYPVTQEKDGRVIEYDCTMVRADALPPQAGRRPRNQA